MMRQLNLGRIDMGLEERIEFLTIQYKNAKQLCDKQRIQITEMETQLELANLMLNNAAIEHSGKTLIQRIALLIARESETSKLCVSAYGKLNQIRDLHPEIKED